jgi:branched-chain amino acid transport system permease protein
MNLQIALILGQDGFTNGAIYALLALSILLVFAVTRILLIPQGEFVAIGALTMGAMQAGEPIRLAWLMLGFTLVEAALDLIAAWQRSRGVGGRLRVSPWVPARIVYAVIVAALALKLPFAQMPMAVQVLMTLLIAVPLGPQTYRLFYQPLAGSSSLVLLIVSVAAHLTMVGLGLLFFGAERSAHDRAFSDAALVSSARSPCPARPWSSSPCRWCSSSRSTSSSSARCTARPARHRDQPGGRAPDGHLAHACRQAHLRWPPSSARCRGC